MEKMMRVCVAVALAGIASASALCASDVSEAEMKALYEEVKTPCKYGVILAPDKEKGELFDNPMVFRHGERWYMMFIRFDGKGYETHLAVSDDLLVWKRLGCIFRRGPEGAWDSAQADGWPTLLDMDWNGENRLNTFEGKYWMMYLGGAAHGYETDPLSTGVAWTDDPSAAREWRRCEGNPVMRPSDPDARAFERKTIYKHFTVDDPSRRLGGRFVNFYNAKQQDEWVERIGTAVSDDLRHWKRVGDGPTVSNTGDLDHGICGDPMVRKIGDTYVMFYFGFNWEKKGGHAFDTFAASKDLVHWTKWTGPKLVEASEPWDKGHAHKPWVIKHKGVVYHFYCAVGDRGRCLALATSKPLPRKWDPSRPLACPVPTEIGVRANPTARHIQRTMKALAESTAEKPAHVRVLFYGQSIVGQQWHTILMDGLKKKYPTAKFEVANRAIGGFTSPDLIRTSESDLYPYYPDLLFFHVYGPLDKYEAIVRKVRETTTAEIVLWTSHLRVGDDPRKMLENRDERSRGILEIGEKYGCMVVDLNRKWCEMLIKNGLDPADLLADGIHMKPPATGAPSFAYYAGMIGEELCRMPGLSGEPEFSGTITEVKATEDLAFDGNRVVAVSDGTGKGETRITLDGREPSSFAEMHYSTRPSAFVSWMPMIKHVDRAPEAMPVVENWTLTYIEGTKSLGNPIHYRVKGSVTGDDGEGWNTNDFRSASGRAIIAKSDFHTWQYGYFYKCNEKYLKEHGQTWSKDSKPGQTITWSVRPLYANPLAASEAGTRTTLVQNCSNGRHRLTLKPSDGAKSGISKFLVYRPAKPLVMKIPSGRHFLKEPMRLSAADSDVTIVGEPGAVLDGSVRLGKFVPDAQGVWHAKAPKGVVADQLFVNDRRATPARTPNRFAFHMAEPVGEWKEPTSGRTQDLGAKGFRVSESEAKLIEAIPAAEREGMRLFVYTSWDTYTMPFDWYDAAGRVICGKGWGRNALFRFGSYCPRYRLENYRGALDEPGEWFFDRKAGEVLYLPLPGETPETVVACVPVTETLLEIRGAKNVTVRNLAFEHAAWRHPGEVKNGQAAMSVDSFAVRVADAENVVFENCRVRHAGAHGLRFQGGTSRCRVSRCLFEDLGAGGVYVGDPTWKKEAGDAALTRFVTVEDSILRNGGVTLPGAVGVWLGQVHDCAVVHNDVSYFRYTGVSAGWTWSATRETPVARNRISYNRLHHLCLGELNDMGGIYTLGISTDSEEIGNWIHDIAGYPWSVSPAWGIYTDEGSTGFLIASNLVENVRDGAIHQNYGNANRFENNIFANCGKGKSFVWRSTPSKGQATFSLTNNIFYTTDRSAKAFWKYDYFGECPIRGFDAKDVPADGNVWWFGGEPAKDAFNLGDWAAWRAEGHDARGVTADPGFVDAANGDWRLKPDSPALKAGFRPFDWRQSGVRGDAAWKREAESFALPPFEDYPPPPRWSRDADRFGFEGGQPAEIFLSGIRGKGIRATTKTVRSGKMALEIEDTVLSGPQSFLPHFSMSTPGATGLRFGYSFAADEKARVTMQTRQWGVPGKPYATGIHLPFKDGKLSVNGRPLITLKPLQWCDLVFEADFFADRVPTWKVTATPQGGKPVTLQIPSAEGDCRQVNWIGWMSECAERACWYFDDFWYELKR